MYKQREKMKIYPIQKFCMGSGRDRIFCLLFYYAQLKRDPLSAGHFMDTVSYLWKLNGYIFTSPMFILHYVFHWFSLLWNVPHEGCKLVFRGLESIKNSWLWFSSPNCSRSLSNDLMCSFLTLWKVWLVWTFSCLE